MYWWNPIGWVTGAPSTAEELAQAAAKAAARYAELGYLDAKVSVPVAETGDDGLTDYVFNVTEGPRYTVGDVSVTGVTRYSVEEVVAKSDLPARGSIAGAKALEEAAQKRNRHAAVSYNRPQAVLQVHFPAKLPQEAAAEEEP